MSLLVHARRWIDEVDPYGVFSNVGASSYLAVFEDEHEVRVDIEFSPHWYEGVDKYCRKYDLLMDHLNSESYCTDSRLSVKREFTATSDDEATKLVVKVEFHAPIPDEDVQVLRLLGKVKQANYSYLAC
ncbi:hypothetical protein HC928_05005 [bacterium]|nr:hypothetical protein [bacterium]